MKKDFRFALRKNDSDTRRGELGGVSLERQNIGQLAEERNPCGSMAIS